METAILVLGIASTVCWILTVVFGVGGHNTLTIWFSFLAIELLIAWGFCTYQKKVWDAAVLPTGSGAPLVEVDLVAGNGQTPQHDSLKSIDKLPDSVKFLFLGDSVIRVDALPCKLITQRGEEMLTLAMDGPNLLVSAQMFDKQGDMMCRIVNNRATRDLINTFTMDHPEPNRLSVLDRKGREFLNVDFINDRAIRLLGSYYLRDGIRIDIQEHHQSLGGLFSGGGFYVTNQTIEVDPPTWVQHVAGTESVFTAGPGGLVFDGRFPLKTAGGRTQIGRPSFSAERATTLPFEVGKAIAAKVLLVNIGDATGELHSQIVAAYIVPKATPLKRVVEQFEAIREETFIKNAVAPEGKAICEFRNLIVMGQESIANVKNGSEILYLMGKIYYLDSASKKRRTWFCFEYSPSDGRMILNSEYSGDE